MLSFVRTLATTLLVLLTAHCARTSAPELGDGGATPTLIAVTDVLFDDAPWSVGDQGKSATLQVANLGQNEAVIVGATFISTPPDVVDLWPLAEDFATIPAGGTTTIRFRGRVAANAEQQVLQLVPRVEVVDTNLGVVLVATIEGG
ncbi:MAG: hypothetical protein JRH20_15240, partial [Deltaproteobacteria bacterium]|nr:hypothetical protein [Deltaproteobacteria bacterium]